MSLQVGDIITTEKPFNGDVLIQVEGKNKFLGQVGQFRGSRAIRLTRHCQQLEAIGDTPPPRRANRIASPSAAGDRR